MPLQAQQNASRFDDIYAKPHDFDKKTDKRHMKNAGHFHILKIRNPYNHKKSNLN